MQDTQDHDTICVRSIIDAALLEREGFQALRNVVTRHPCEIDFGNPGNLRGQDRQESVSVIRAGLRDMVTDTAQVRQSRRRDDQALRANDPRFPSSRRAEAA